MTEKKPAPPKPAPPKPAPPKPSPKIYRDGAVKKEGPGPGRKR